MTSTMLTDAVMAVPLRRSPAGTPGVLLYVADNGPGVPEELRERVFDPFFTTKGPSDGVGLGLAIVARNVYEAGGAVWVDRAREGGAVFKVFLPLAEAAEAHRRMEAAEQFGKLVLWVDST